MAGRQSTRATVALCPVNFGVG